MNSLTNEYINIYKQYKIQTLYDKILMYTNITYNYEQLSILLNYFDYKYDMVASKYFFIYYSQLNAIENSCNTRLHENSCNTISLTGSLFPKNLLYASQILNNFAEVNKICIEDSRMILYDIIAN